MAFKGINFHGTRIFLPGVYPYVDVSAFQKVTGGTGKAIGVIGTCSGGQPRTILEFSSLIDALQTLRDGQAVEEIVRMFSPGPGVTGSPVIKMYRINNAVQAALTYDSKLVFTAKDYGQWTNDIRLSIATGTDSGKKITLDVMKTDVSETRDNLGRCLYIQYVGEGSAAAMHVGKLPTPSAPAVALASGEGALANGANYVAIAYINEFGEEGSPSPASALITTSTPNSGVTVTLPTGASLPPGAASIAVYHGTTATVASMKRATAVVAGTSSYVIVATPAIDAVNPQASNTSRMMLRTRITAGAAGEDLDLDLTSFGLNTILELSTYLEGLASYTSDLLSQDADMPSSYLDTITNQDILTTQYIINANLGSIIYWVNSYSNLVSVAAVANASGAPANTTVAVPLSGGNDGPPLTISDWQGAFDAFMTSEINYMFPVSTDPVVHYMGKVHVINASSIQERKYRQLFVGGDVSLTDSGAIQAKRSLSHELVTFCYPGITRRNLFSGDIEELSGMSWAAIIVGMAASYPYGEPITNKPVDILASQRVFTTSEMTTLSQEGLCIPRKNYDTGDFVVLRDATTYVADTNTVLRRISGVESVHEISRQLIAGVQPFVGRKGNILTVASIRQATVAVLNSLTVTPTNPDGLLTEGRKVNGEVLPSYENLVVSYDGQIVVGVRVDVRMVGSIELITIDARAIPAEITLMA